MGNRNYTHTHIYIQCSQYIVIYIYEVPSQLKFSLTQTIYVCKKMFILTNFSKINLGKCQEYGKKWKKNLFWWLISMTQYKILTWIGINVGSRETLKKRAFRFC